MAATVEVPVVWLQGASCTGCVVSVLNAFSPSIHTVLLRELTPGKHLNLRFLLTAMAGQGAQVVDVLRDTRKKKPGGYVLLMEGSIQLTHPAFASMAGEGDEEVPISEVAAELAKNALAVVSLGTCASFGGIPSAAPNPTGAISMAELCAREKIDTPIVNIPGCPPHPDWLIGSLAAVMRYGLDAVQVDEVGRPKIFYGKLVHETCQRRPDFDAGKFAKAFGEPGCLYELGCKGPVSYADCPTRQWNSGTNYCIGAGSPCHGCTEPDFIDRYSPMYKKISEERLALYRVGDEAKA